MTKKYTRLIGILVGAPLLVLSAVALPNFLDAQTALTTPEIIDPAHNAVVTSAELDKVDWTNATGGTPPYQYQYQSFSDAAYTNNLFTSDWMSASEISTVGTPEGDYYLRVRARDSAAEQSVTLFSNGAGDPHKVTVDNTPDTNQAPVLDAIPTPVLIPELSPFSFDANATDPDGDTLTFNMLSAPAGATLNSSTGVFNWTPSEAQGPGNYTFGIRVSDGSLGDGQSVTIRVTEVPAGNAAPVLAAITTPVTIPELSPFSFDANASDANGDTLTFSLMSAPSGATINSSTGVFNWTPSEAQGPGDYTFTVRVSDGSLMDDQSVTIHVTEVSAPANATVSATKIVCPEESMLPNWATSTTLTTVTSNTDDRFLSAHPQCSRANWTFEYAADPEANPGDNDPGATGGEWTAFSDGTENIAAGRVWFREQVDDDYIPFTGSSNNVSAEMYCGSDIVGYDNYEFVDLVAGQTFHCIAFNVLKDDGGGDNAAPVLAAISSPVTIPELSPFSFDANATDADGDTLTFSLMSAPSGATINSSTGVFNWTPNEAQGPGNYTFTVRVSDGDQEDTQSVTINVTEVGEDNDGDNDAPVLSQLPFFKVIPELSNYSFDANATDADGDTLTFSLEGEPAGATINSSTGVFNWTPTEAQGPGFYVMRVVVSDGDEEDDQLIFIRVTEVRDNDDDDDPDRPRNIRDCMRGGWRDFDDPSFKNQGQCIKHVLQSVLGRGNRR